MVADAASQNQLLRISTFESEWPGRRFAYSVPLAERLPNSIHEKQHRAQQCLGIQRLLAEASPGPATPSELYCSLGPIGAQRKYLVYSQKSDPTRL